MLLRGRPIVVALSAAVAAALTAAGPACTPHRAPAAPIAAAPGPLAAAAGAGVDDPTLRALLVDHWEDQMRRSPVWATSLGDHRFDDQLGRFDEASLAAGRKARDRFLARARAIAPSTLDARDAVTLALFVQMLEGAAATDACRDELWSVSARSNALVMVEHLPDAHPVATPADGEHLVARLRQVPGAVDALVANLSDGLGAGLVAPAETVRRTVAQLDEALARPTASWRVVVPADAPHADWPDDARLGFRTALVDAVDHGVRPALTRYRDFLRDRVLPHARTGAAEGLGGLPDGAACYRGHILDELGLAQTPEELHAFGEAEIARSDRAIAELGAKVLGTRDLAATLARLRTDPALYFKDKDELLAAAAADLARAQAAIPRFFGRLPRTTCVVREIPAAEAPFTTIAYYDPPNLDGSKPGEFYVNTYKPEVRPRYELAALAAHESIPGHHLQIALAQELGDLPLFRRNLGTTAFVEGWALYTERLADEMGLYADELDRLGAASFDAWRGARLVVDTGLHAMGWTRAQAEQYMRAHTALTDENIGNEVDRYIASPGQALAYKVGQRKILELRARAEKALGPAFDLRAFHDAVLAGGAVTLPVLETQVEAWMLAGGPAAPAVAAPGAGAKPGTGAGPAR